MLSRESAAGNCLAPSRGLALLPGKETAGLPVQCQIIFSFCTMSAPYMGPALSNAKCCFIAFQCLLILVELNMVNTLREP